MNPKPVALLFSTVWPEPESSAAGVRQLQWVRFLNRAGFRVVISSPSRIKLKVESAMEYEALPLPLNQSSVKDDLKNLSPVIVMFDRFILEEQFGHFVYENCPEALILLETQDLHLIRRVREGLKEKYLSMPGVEPRVYHTETALRETASIQRVDYSYVVSSFEETFLAQTFGIEIDKVQWVPFFFEHPMHDGHFQKSFQERDGFSWVGNFRHAPNLDGMRWFLRDIWPKVHAVMPDAKLHIHGAYPTEEVMNWNKPAHGIFSHGPAKSLDVVFAQSRVNLAPLRFGAGIKGKILEGFRYGLPCVTTKIGVEGLLPVEIGNYAFPGIEANSAEDFVKACVELYQNESTWSQARFDALKLLHDIYSEEEMFPKVQEQMEHLLQRKQSGDLPTWNSRILRHELHNGHKYFSKWIELKERSNP